MKSLEEIKQDPLWSGLAEVSNEDIVQMMISFIEAKSELEALEIMAHKLLDREGSTADEKHLAELVLLVLTGRESLQPLADNLQEFNVAQAKARKEDERKSRQLLETVSKTRAIIQQMQEERMTYQLEHLPVVGEA